MAQRETQARHGEKMIEVRVRFFTNNLVRRPENISQKTARAKVVVTVEPNRLYDIVSTEPKSFNSLLDLGAVIEKVLIEHGIVLHPSQKMKKYMPGSR
jgi:hypothetical protein